MSPFVLIVSSGKRPIGFWVMRTVEKGEFKAYILKKVLMSSSARKLL